VNQIDNTDTAIPESLVKHATAIEKLRRTEPGLAELLEDHARLTEAIHYWNGKSAGRVEEFARIARELEREIVQFVIALQV